MVQRSGARIRSVSDKNLGNSNEDIFSKLLNLKDNLYDLMKKVILQISKRADDLAATIKFGQFPLIMNTVLLSIKYEMRAQGRKGTNGST